MVQGPGGGLRLCDYASPKERARDGSLVQVRWKREFVDGKSQQDQALHQMNMLKNRTLYFGDNLEILREKIPDESFDLIYLDPPFNSNRNYNVIFREGLQDSPAQVHAFEDSWHWNREAQATFEELAGVRPSKTKVNQQIADLMLALEKLVGHNDMLAYLTMMAIRLIELRRVLKSSGSIYLHCDPTAGHYLKIVMDAIFGKENVRNEIVWKRTSAHNDPKRFGRIHDVILYYAKSDAAATFNPVYTSYDQSYLDAEFRQDEHGRWFKVEDLTAPSHGGSSGKFEFHGRVPGSSRMWRMNETEMERLLEEGRIKTDKDGKPLLRGHIVYLDEKKGMPAQDWWGDVLRVGNTSKERLGYPTQKPEALLERIIKASSNEGDWVLDPFCGCGTTVSVAERLNRNWVGIDITMLAVNLIRHRLAKQFEIKSIEVFVDGRPKDVSAARALFQKDPFEFEYWALDLVNAIPAQSKTEGKMRGADKGVDGVINFLKDVSNGGKQEYGKLLVQVKGGKVQRDDIATLKGDIEREKADGGVFITLEEPTRPMKEEAVDAGSYEVRFSQQKFPKIQILTIEELLNNKKPEVPLVALPYYKEAKASKFETKTKGLGI